MGSATSGNPAPKLENLTPFPRVGTEPLAARLTVRLTVAAHAALSGMDGASRQAFIRAAVEEKLIRDGLL